ncbi:MAG TPA: hypothetical protein VF331_11695, partial [Polyangiales bacterium]
KFRRMLKHSRFLPLPLLLVLLACERVSDERPIGATLAELDTSAPPARVGNPLGTTAFGWAWDDAGGTASDPSKCHACETTPSTLPGVELPAIIRESTTPPVVSHAAATLAAYSIDAWQPGPGGLQATYRAAALAGDNRLAAGGDFDNVATTLADVKSDLETICSLTNAGSCKVTTSFSRSNWTRPFSRVQGRHREAGFVRGPDGVDRLQTYSLPSAFAEQRLRSAKTYCALRSAALAQNAENAYELDANDTGSWWKWTLGQRSGSVKILPSEKFVDRGSEAFMMPIALSSRLAPVAGPVFPDFGEMSHELVWVSGDREVRSVEDLGRVHDQICRPTPFGTACIPFDVTTYKSLMRNLEHVDVMAGVENHGRVDLQDVILVRYAFFDVNLNGFIAVDTGVPVAPSEPLDDGLGAGRVELFSKFPFLPPRSPELDGSDALSTADAPLVLNGSFQVAGGGSSVRSAIPTQSTLTRWRNDDDRALQISDRVKEVVTIGAGADFTLGPVRVGIHAASTLDLTVQQDFVLREQLGLVDAKMLQPLTLSFDRNVAQTNLLVIPQSAFSAVWKPLAFELVFDLHVVIDVPFGPIDFDIHWTQPLFSIGDVPIKDDVTSGGEIRRLRVGEYSEADATPPDGASQQPKVYSHVPGAGHLAGFTSFPASVAACLADPSISSTPPPPASHSTPPGPVDGYLCIVGPMPFPTNTPLPDSVCSDFGARNLWAHEAAQSWPHNATSEPQRANQIAAETTCIAQMIGLGCVFPSKRLDANTLSHVFTKPEAVPYGLALEQCSEAFAMGAADEAEAKATSEFIAKNIMPIRECSADGTPTK